MTAQGHAWKDLLRDSSWVTIAWDWFMTFLSRAAESVLWVSMVFSCYQLIPGAPQPPASASNGVFICQFIALDVGGMGLNKLAQRQGLSRWSYVRVIAYILIAVTLITVGYAGLERVFPLDPTVTKAVEVTLVVIRSIMTVLYGQAIHDLKLHVRSAHDEITELQAALLSVQSQLSTKHTEVDTLRQHLNSVQSQLHIRQTEVDTLRQQVSSGQQELDTLRKHLNSTRQEQPDGGQVAEKQVSANTSHVIPLASRRVRSSTSQQEDAVLEAQIRALLANSPGLSGRAIAAKVRCSPTTASKWKSIIEKDVRLVAGQHGQ